jgi:hypothetical protein
MNDLFLKPVSSKDRIKEYLMRRVSATNAEIAEYMRGTPGQLSWGQRIREIRQELIAEGGDLKCSEVRPGIYLYRVITPDFKKAIGEKESA